MSIDIDPEAQTVRAEASCAVEDPWAGAMPMLDLLCAHSLWPFTVTNDEGKLVGCCTTREAAEAVLRLIKG